MPKCRLVRHLHRGKVFNAKRNLALSTTHLNTLSKRTPYELEGEMQKMILQGLTRKENIVQGLSECESRAISQAGLNQLKETYVMLRDTWNRSGRK